jgi:hypothetical protein
VHGLNPSFVKSWIALQVHKTYRRARKFVTVPLYILFLYIRPVNDEFVLAFLFLSTAASITETKKQWVLIGSDVPLHGGHMLLVVSND